MPVTNCKAKSFNFFEAITRDSDAVILPGDLILSYLSKHDQLNLRCCSRDAAQFVEERMLPDLFSALHISCESVAALQLRLAPRVLRYVVSYCRELIIHIPPPVATTTTTINNNNNNKNNKDNPAHVRALAARLHPPSRISPHRDAGAPRRAARHTRSR
jgi:hypothetical protein